MPGVGQQVLSAFTFMVSAPSGLLNEIENNWKGLVAIGMALFAGWCGHDRLDEIATGPERDRSLMQQLKAEETTRAREDSALQATDNRQWAAIKGLLENQRLIICRSIEGNPPESCNQVEDIPLPE